jgi:hypothetical protein
MILKEGFLRIILFSFFNHPLIHVSYAFSTVSDRRNRQNQPADVANSSLASDLEIA